MDRQKALTLPFTVDKDKLMDNPIRIPMVCLSPEIGGLHRQVSWAAVSGCRIRLCDLQLKKGSRSFDHNHQVMVKWGMARKKLCLILTDVLKTDLGKAYMERTMKSHTNRNKGHVPSAQRERGQCTKEQLNHRDARDISQRTSNDGCKTPKCTEKHISSSPVRSKSRRWSQKPDQAEYEDEQKDLDEVLIGTNGEDYKFAEVVGCGLSVSWEPDDHPEDCDEFSPSGVDDRPTVHSLKRKKKVPGYHHNGMGTPKRQSVLRLTGENGKDGGPAQTHVHLEQDGEDYDFQNMDQSIVQFTEGACGRTDVLLPFISPTSQAGASGPRLSLSSGQDQSSQTSPPEPIVVSSDDESSDPQQCRSAVHTLVAVEDPVIQQQSSGEDVGQNQELSAIEDMEVYHVVVDCPPPAVDDFCMRVAFRMLHCGGHQGVASGHMMITHQKIIIPLKDISSEAEVKISLERKEMRRYSIWNQEEMEDRGLCFQGSEEPPAAAVLFCVSERAAAALRLELGALCSGLDGTTNTGKASPFIVLTLPEPLLGIERALLHSNIEMDCLQSLTVESTGALKGFPGPHLSLDHSLELIADSELDPHLLLLLGRESPRCRPDTDRDSPRSGADTIPHMELELDLQEAVTLDEEAEAAQPEPEQKEQEPEQPTEKASKGPAAAYTLCRYRTKGSYVVSMCTPDSTWTKYKHEGLTRRLIQFPPPPLKGGITVTMEDLQCLDSGQYLNDVIIDFYLKYLIQDSSPAVAERCHIFSSFFYKQLTRRDNASEGTTSESCQRQRRHQRVKTWTRHVDIFKKDFLFVPVNQEAHWYLVVICFPGLEEPRYEAWTGSGSPAGDDHSGTNTLPDQDKTQGKTSSSDKTERSTWDHRDAAEAADAAMENVKEESPKVCPPGPVNCTERSCQMKTVCQRPCILIMDSLKLSLHERVFKLLREYLQSEWEVRRGSTREFGADQMKSSHCKVPLQNNSSDCGLYLLQYVESFLKDPVVHFDLPLHLQRWFPRQQVRRKREEIRDLVLRLYRQQDLGGNR